MTDTDTRPKVAFVAASSRGLGRATALQLAQTGARVAVSGRNEGEISRVVQEIKDSGGEAAGFLVDVTSAAAIEQGIAAVEQRWGGVDILVTNTGGPPPGRFDDLDDDRWQIGFDLTLLSAIRLVRAALPGMKARGWGRIVSILSSSTKEPIDGLMLSNVFRPALAALVKALALEVAPDGILVNGLSPGRFNTNRVRSLDQARAQNLGITPEEVREQAIKRIPIGRYGDPAELARVAAFLASAENSYMTGQTLLVDGGMVRAL
jgi:3-oxoacyl-[acyl-carrier protein] reductase